MSYRVALTLPAQEQGWTISDWWSLHRQKAPGLFDSELARGLSFLAAAPLTGMVHPGLPGETRRLLLRRSRYHLYYRVFESERRVEVVAIWHSSQGDAPPL